MLALRKAKGFTLVEIMIVVAIIGLLAAIAIPNFIKARDSARKNICINNLRQLESSKDQWALEENKSTLDTPLSTDLDVYIKGGTAALKCPAGGTTFADSYTINAVHTNAACIQSPSTHNLD